MGPGVESRVQLAAIDCRSVACVLEGQKCEVTREGPTVRGLVRSPEFPEFFRNGSEKSGVPENSGVIEWER